MQAFLQGLLKWKSETLQGLFGDGWVGGVKAQ